jgi:hypothetical protein
VQKSIVVEHLCECGCGKETPLYTRTYSARGAVKGQPTRFLVGHISKVNHPRGTLTHGMSSSPEWAAYKDAHRRCLNPNVKNYKEYGGRGIKFLFTSFEQFFAHIGPRPESKLPSGLSLYSLDRIDNDGNYEIGNVRWSTRSEQERSKRHFTKEETLCRRA